MQNLSALGGWLFLLGAIMSEVVGTTCMKVSAGFTKLMPSLGMVAAYVVSLTCLTFALRAIEMGVAYAIWSGLGTLMIALIGVVLYQEQVSALKVVSLALVIIGVVGLKLSLGNSS